MSITQPAPEAPTPRSVGDRHTEVQSAVPSVATDVQAPTLDGRLVEYANLDHAASAPALTTVVDAVASATRTYASVHRGSGHASRVTTAYYEGAREEVGAFVGARSDDEVIFTRNTTDGMNLLAGAVPEGTTVVVFAAEHHATLLPWDARRTVRLPLPHTVDEAEALLDTALSSAGEALVVLSGASNVTGEVWPVRRLSDVARARGARVALDAAQLAPHRRIDLDDLGADYVAFSGHKVYAPYGAGALVGPRDWLDVAAPYLAGGGATCSVTAQGVEWQRGVARHEAGSPNVLGAVAIAAACATFRRHRPSIEAHESALTERLFGGLAGISGVRTYRLFEDGLDLLPVATFTVEGMDPCLVSTVLSAEHGIGVRDGRFCAHLLVDSLLAGHEPTGTAVRASAGLGTTAEHVDRLLAALRELTTRGPRFGYTHVDGVGWHPDHDTRTHEVRLPW